MVWRPAVASDHGERHRFQVARTRARFGREANPDVPRLAGWIGPVAGLDARERGAHRLADLPHGQSHRAGEAAIDLYRQLLPRPARRKTDVHGARHLARRIEHLLRKSREHCGVGALELQLEFLERTAEPAGEDRHVHARHLLELSPYHRAKLGFRERPLVLGCQLEVDVGLIDARCPARERRPGGDVRVHHLRMLARDRRDQFAPFECVCQVRRGRRLDDHLEFRAIRNGDESLAEGVLHQVHGPDEAHGPQGQPLRSGDRAPSR